MEFLTEEEYGYLKRTIKLDTEKKKDSLIWTRAFQVYNLNHIIPICMQRGRNYHIVLSYIKARLNV